MSRMQDEMNLIRSTYAGIDVSKGFLDTFLLPHNTKLQFDNNKTGIQKLVKHCKRAVRMVFDGAGQHESRWAAICVDCIEDRLCAADAERMGQEGRG